MRSMLLWLIGIPLPIILILWLVSGHAWSRIGCHYRNDWMGALVRLAAHSSLHGGKDSMAQMGLPSLRGPCERISNMRLHNRARRISPDCAKWKKSGLIAALFKHCLGPSLRPVGAPLTRGSAQVIFSQPSRSTRERNFGSESAWRIPDGSI